MLTELAIWNIIFLVVECAEYLQSHFQTIGNINPRTIYVLNDGIKLFEVNHIFNIESSYELALKKSVVILYSEQIEQLQRNIQVVRLYTKFYTSDQLDKNQIFQNLQYTKSQYSELLFGLIQKMFLENLQERQSWIDIKEFIDSFKILEEKDQPFYSNLKLCPQITKKVNRLLIESVQQNTQITQTKQLFLQIQLKVVNNQQLFQHQQQLKPIFHPIQISEINQFNKFNRAKILICNLKLHQILQIMTQI